MLGWYNPLESEQDRMISVDAARVQHWLNHGAQMSENVQALLKKNVPSIVRTETQKEVQRRAKAAAKRKAKKTAKA
jgi:small subunit ribosomal protein S16